MTYSITYPAIYPSDVWISYKKGDLIFFYDNQIEFLGIRSEDLISGIFEKLSKSKSADSFESMLSFAGGVKQAKLVNLKLFNIPYSKNYKPVMDSKEHSNILVWRPK